MGRSACRWWYPRLFTLAVPLFFASCRSGPIELGSARRAKAPDAESAQRERSSPRNPALDQADAARAGAKLRPGDARELRADKVAPLHGKMLQPVGRDLARAAKEKNTEFDFSTLLNPNPRVHHTANGHIYVSSGLLERVANKDELAAVLALEMAEFLAEKETPAAGAVIPASGTDESFPVHAVDPTVVDQRAGAILRAAGYGKADVRAARAKLLSANRPVARPEVLSASGRMAN